MEEKSLVPGRDNIVLIGMPGAGKSTLGIVLAKILCMDFVDADLLIQQSCDKSLQRLIDTLGPDAFIEIENQVLSEMSFEHSVIATGGSAVYSDAAMEHLGKIGRIVYLKINFDELKCRLADRPQSGCGVEVGGCTRAGRLIGGFPRSSCLAARTRSVLSRVPWLSWGER